jgi:hypothetical protein
MGSSYTALGYFDICRLGATQILRPVLRLAPIYSSAIPGSKKEGTLRNCCRHRPVQYLNNILEQDHRAIKRRVNAKQGFRGFRAARRTIQGYEAVHMSARGKFDGWRESRLIQSTVASRQLHRQWYHPRSQRFTREVFPICSLQEVQSASAINGEPFHPYLRIRNR